MAGYIPNFFWFWKAKPEGSQTALKDEAESSKASDDAGRTDGAGCCLSPTNTAEGIYNRFYQNTCSATTEPLARFAANFTNLANSHDPTAHQHAPFFAASSHAYNQQQKSFDLQPKSSMEAFIDGSRCAFSWLKNVLLVEAALFWGVFGYQYFSCSQARDCSRLIYTVKSLHDLPSGLFWMTASTVFSGSALGLAFCTEKLLSIMACLVERILFGKSCVDAFAAGSVGPATAADGLNYAHQQRSSEAPDGAAAAAGFLASSSEHSKWMGMLGTAAVLAGAGAGAGREAQQQRAAEPPRYNTDGLVSDEHLAKILDGMEYTQPANDLYPAQHHRAHHQHFVTSDQRQQPANHPVQHDHCHHDHGATSEAQHQQNAALLLDRAKAAPVDQGPLADWLMTTNAKDGEEGFERHHPECPKHHAYHGENGEKVDFQTFITDAWNAVVRPLRVLDSPETLSRRHRERHEARLHHHQHQQRSLQPQRHQLDNTSNNEHHQERLTVLDDVDRLLQASLVQQQPSRESFATRIAQLGQRYLLQRKNSQILSRSASVASSDTYDTRDTKEFAGASNDTWS